MLPVASITLFGILLFLAVCPTSTIAQGKQEELGNSTANNTVREVYLGSSNLPDGIAFISTARLIVSLNADDPETAEALVMDRVGVVDVIAARTFISEVQESLRLFEKKVNERGREILCEKGLPRAYGEDGFMLLDVALDSSDEISEQHYHEFKDSIKQETAAKLHDWVSASKRNTSHIRFDQKALAEQSGVVSVDSELSALCADSNRANRGPRK